MKILKKVLMLLGLAAIVAVNGYAVHNEYQDAFIWAMDAVILIVYIEGKIKP